MHLKGGRCKFVGSSYLFFWEGSDYRSLLRDRERRIIEIEKEELEKRENEVIPDIIGVFFKTNTFES